MVAEGVTDTEPDVPLAVKPVPVHDVALVDENVSVDDWPATIEVGLALRVAVGGVGTETITVVEALAEPPAPVQVRP